MRVPTNSNSQQMVDRISDLSSKQAKLQSQVSTGQRIVNPEDDPAAVGRVLTLQGEQREVSQYSQNATYALDVSNATYSALQSLKTVSDRAGEIATLGVGSLNAESNASYATELNELIDQGIQLGNSKLNNDYLFGGTNLSNAPIERTPTTGDATSVAYMGGTTELSLPIAANSSINPGSSIATNQGVTDLLTHMIALRDALNANDATAITAARDAIIGTDTTSGDEDTIVMAISQQGAVQTRIEVTQELYTKRLEDITSLVSGESEIQMPEAITKLNQTSIAYQAALQSTAQIMKISLLDYIS